jgi:hypothetical protein
MAAELAADFHEHERLYRKALDGELNRWGKWIERHMDYEGFPGTNILVAFTQGSGGGNPGHRILCLDMPTAVYSVHHRVIMLQETLQEAVWIWYVPRLKQDGTLWTVQERCLRAGLGEEALRQRLKRAKDRILGL